MASRGDINSEEIQPTLKNDWLKIKIDQTIEKTGAFTKLKSKEFSDVGNFPVVDQGDKFISGYVNDEKLLYKGELPVIIFGDHTRNVKYVDFQFAAGADGTKILKPNKFYDPKFYFYYFKSLRVPNLGYSRHFSILKVIDFPLPSLPEQKRIVKKLDNLFNQLQIIKKSMANIPLLLKYFRQQILTQAVSGKLTEEWRQGKKLEELKKMKVGNFMKEVKEKIDPTKIKEVKYIGLEHIKKDGGIIEIGNSIDLKSNKTVFKKGDVLYGKLRPYLNKHDVVTFDGICSTDILVYRNENLVSSKYFNYYLGLSTTVELLNAEAKGINLPRVTATIVNDLDINVPPHIEQQEIVRRVESLFAKADAIEQQYKSLNEKINTLPQALLHKAFKGELTEQLDNDGDARELLKEIKIFMVNTKKTKKNSINEN
jgi:type I restriction enzyme, S subunit